MHLSLELQLIPPRAVRYTKLVDEYLASNPDLGRFTRTAARNILLAMMTDRLDNYGYGVRDWRRIQSQRQRARARLYRQLDRFWALDWSSLNTRWDSATGRYVVGQSANEEVTNAMRALCRQDRWVS